MNNQSNDKIKNDPTLGDPAVSATGPRETRNDILISD